MRVVEHHLFNRNGFYYFRSSIPRALQSILGFQEIKIALGTQDLSEARIQSVQLSYGLNKAIRGFQQNLRELSPAQSPEPVIEALIAQIRDLKGAVSQRTPERFTQTQWKGKPSQKLLFSLVVQKYLDDSPADSHSTREHKESTYTLFREIMGDLPFKDIGIEEGRVFKSRLLKIPANAKRVWNIGTFENIDWEKVSTDKPQHPRTINNRLSYLGVLFSWAEGAGYYHGTNPFKGLLIPKSQKVVSSRCHPFNQDEIKSLFLCPLFTGSAGERWSKRLEKGSQLFQDNLYWVPLIALYSGMRLNEVCQLYVSDIRQEDGIYIYDVNDDGDDKALKTFSSRRKIPVHKELIRRGFLAYVIQKQKEGEQRLFPDIPMGTAAKNYSSTFTKRFWRLLNALEIKRQGLCFHSLRHTFIDGLRNAGVERSIVMTLTGHQASRSVHDNYGYGYNLSILEEGINKLSFPALEE